MSEVSQDFFVRRYRRIFHPIPKLEGQSFKRIIFTDKEITTLFEAKNQIKSTGRFNSSIICTAKCDKNRCTFTAAAAHILLRCTSS